MGELAYVSEVRVERLGGPLRAAYLPGEQEPVVYGMHGAVAEHYGRSRGSSRAMPAPSTTWSAPPWVDSSGRSPEPSRPGGSTPPVWWGKHAARSSWRARSWS